MAGNIGFGVLRQQSLGGRIAGTLFCLAFLLMGSVFLALMARETFRIIQSRQWPAVPCVIESSSIANRSSGYEIQVRYRYDFGGKTWHSQRLKMQTTTSTDYAALQRQVDAYPAGAASQCFVNPSDPAEAVLRLDDLWILPFALIPLIFVAVGAFGIFALWHGPPATFIRPAPAQVAAARGSMVLFGIFAIVGGVLFYFFVVRVALDVMAARNWTATPCLVQSSTVRAHSGKSTTYSIDILYQYEINGSTYQSNHYDFLGGSSDGYSSKEAIVRQFPPGTRTVCYVNPDDPADVVFDRGFSTDMWIGFLPLIFLAVGVGGMARMYILRRRSSLPGLLAE